MKYMRLARIARELSQTALSYRSGTPQATISNIETGTVAEPDLATLDRIAEVLDVPAHRLLDDVEIDLEASHAE